MTPKIEVLGYRSVFARMRKCRGHKDMMNDYLETDEEFLGYVELHSNTPRALFHRDHAQRLIDLANQSIFPVESEWLVIHNDIAQPLVDAARKRLQKCCKDPSCWLHACPTQGTASACGASIVLVEET